MPIGVLLIGSAFVVLARDNAQRIESKFDAAGATTITGGLLLLVYALNRGADHGWTSASTLLLFGVAGLLLIAFVGVESRSQAPLVPAAALRHRTLVAANLSAFFTFGAFFSFIFLGSLLMQQVLGYSPTKTGVSWLATSVTAFIASGLTGARLVGNGRRAQAARRRSHAAGARHAVAGAGAGRRRLRVVICCRRSSLAGVAIGLCAPSLQISALTGVAESSAGIASGLVETMREVGGAAGVAAVSTALVSRAGLAGFHAGVRADRDRRGIGAITAAVAFQRRPATAPTRDVRVARLRRAKFAQRRRAGRLLDGAAVWRRLTTRCRCAVVRDAGIERRSSDRRSGDRARSQ